MDRTAERRDGGFAEQEHGKLLMRDMNVEVLDLADADEIGHPIRHRAPAGLVAHPRFLDDGAVRLMQRPDVDRRAAGLAREAQDPVAGNADLDESGLCACAHEAVPRLAVEHGAQGADEGGLAAIVRADQRVHAWAQAQRRILIGLHVDEPDEAQARLRIVPSRARIGRLHLDA